MTHAGWPTLLNCARVALLSLLSLFCTNITVGQTVVGETAASPEIALRYTLEDLGFNAPLKLSGVDGTYGVRLNLPRHLETTSAILHLNYTHSDTLLDGLSHINVKIDGKHITTLPIRQDDAGKLLEESLELPAQWLGPDSEINLQLIGHYSMACENPRHPNLWAEISNTTSLQLVTRQKRWMTVLTIYLNHFSTSVRTAHWKLPSSCPHPLMRPRLKRPVS
ncbi:cellulose biosynthesis cyclic di-GMP-binding regulatory protein BcsB [Neopusillimonas aromaticivorans]|nr:cellulose biosynthesis cyclic di-GMP-binding regulatory protein BcsB [Neopusillimonas aromaticivorans]WJJ94296.1 cellulose biosynthesis cyclic di-GMP-binding regulatory protein BcsB [Neopusillimonas aromaticivorans]